jgi:hypothetical protein
MIPRRLTAVGITVLALGAAVPGLARGERGERDYSISVEVAYGEHPARERYREDLERAVSSWLASTGPLGAPGERGEADLHLQLTLHRVDVDRSYASAPPEPNVLFEPGQASGETYSTLFEVTVALQDPLQKDETIVDKRFTVFNEQGYSEFIHDPRQRSWDVNVEFLLDRIDAFLEKRQRKILKYLDEHPRPSAAPAEGH